MDIEQAKRTIIIGDVHGCLAELNSLITKVNYQKGKDELYFLGDLVSRGPFSKEVFFRILELEGKSILGNHEWQLLQQVNNNRLFKNSKKLQSEFGADFDFFLDEIRCWPVFIETNQFILVHGGLDPSKELNESDPGILTSIRTWDGAGKELNNPENPPWFELYQGKKLVVFGHWAALKGIVRKNVIGLDTGCVYGRELSALILPERKIITVAAERVYRPVKES